MKKYLRPEIELTNADSIADICSASGLEADITSDPMFDVFSMYMSEGNVTEAEKLYR